MESKIKISTRALWLLVAAVLALTLFAGLPAEKARAADGGTYVIRVSKSSSDYGGYGQSASEFVVQSGGSDVGQVYCASVGRRFAGSADGTARVGDTASLAFYDIDDTTANPRLSSADRLLIKKALYYGAGGPEDILTSAFGFDQAYQITHFVVAAADGYSNPSEPLPTGGDMASFRSTINGKDDPPDSFHVYRYTGYERTGEQQDGQNMVLWEMEANGKLAVSKSSSVPSISDGNGCYSLAGAEYTVYDGDGQPVGVLTVTADGSSNTLELPKGDYTVRETKAAQGYALDGRDGVSATVRAGEKTTVAVKDTPQNDPINVFLQKRDSVTGETAQGNGTLGGAEFTVKYYDGQYTSSSLPGSAERTWVFKTDEDGFTRYSPDYKVSGDDLYTSSSGAYALPLGTVTVQETKAPDGYTINEQLFVANIISSGTNESVFTFNDGDPLELGEVVIKGGVRIQKTDSETRANVPQGDASLAGAVFEITNESDNAVVVNGTSYAKGRPVMTITTNAQGVAATAANALPYGTYEIKEKTAPAGYKLNSSFSETFDVTQDGVIVDLSSKPCGDDVIRGGAEFTKFDLELDTNEALGGASLEGIEFTVTNMSANAVMYNGESVAKNAAVDTFLTDAEGKVAIPKDALPYGTYTIKETKTNDSYLLTDGRTLTFQIREDGESVTTDTSGNDLVLKDQVIRNDFQFNKIADGTNRRMSDVAWLLTQLKTGEKHVIVTDRNGSFASDAYAHSSDTNANDAIIGSYDLTNDVVPSSALNYKAGVWFSAGEKGSEAAVNDDLGALPYGDYRLQEIRCEANEGYKLLDFEFYVERDGSKASAIDLGTLTDDAMPEISLGTTAVAQETDTHEVQAGESVTIVDAVAYTGVTIGEEYVLKGALMNADTGAALIDEGYTVVCEDVTFTAAAESGSVDMTFIVSGEDLAGLKTVVFERLVQGDLVVGKHEDLEDEGQTVNIIDIGTTASGVDTTTDVIPAAGDTLIIDYVEYTGLIPRQKHKVTGTLMNAETGKDLKDEGITYKTEAVEFTPEEPDGTVQVQFTLDTSQLTGQKIVVFEDLYLDKIKVATHADLTDEGQTVTVEEGELPEIGTTATSEDGEKVIGVDKAVVLEDVISYIGLTPGEEYTIEGTLMNAETGKQLAVQGATLKTTFTPDEADGKTIVRFTVDTRTLGGASIVVFEDLSLNGELVAKHHDITDKGQTVTVGKISIGTMATIGGKKEAEIASETVITDTVDFKGLTTGKEYTLSGVLMDKATGKAVLIQGEEVRNERKFVAPSESGAINITFTLNSLGLDGKDVVVFESLLLDGIEIASHVDLKDEGQTVHFNGPKGFPAPKTGDDTTIMPYIIAACIAGAAIAILIILKKKGLLLKGNK